MIRKKEINIRSFNKDVSEIGSYAYTTKSVYSALTATERQSREIYRIINTYFGKNIKILDIGCGDGTYTLELFKSIKPKSIIGFDFAENAIMMAKKNNKNNKNIIFENCDIYQIYKKFGQEKYDFAVARGVLHHLYNPEAAIREIAKTISRIIVLEPNGYNPVLKIIEKTSKYHIEHEEQSFFPPSLNNWFKKQGFKVVEQKFIGLVPYFFPEIIAKLFKKIEPLMEKIPYISRFYLGTNVIFYEKNLQEKSLKNIKLN